MSAQPRYRLLDSGEVVRIDDPRWTLVRCRECRRPVRFLDETRRGRCNRCALPAVARLARARLRAGPCPDASMVAFVAKLGLERHDGPAVRRRLDVELVDVDGVACWALPQHQPLEVDDRFHEELTALLDQGSGGATRLR